MEDHNRAIRRRTVPSGQQGSTKTEVAKVGSSASTITITNESKMSITTNHPVWYLPINSHFAWRQASAAHSMVTTLFVHVLLTISSYNTHQLAPVIFDHHSSTVTSILTTSSSTSLVFVIFLRLILLPLSVVTLIWWFCDRNPPTTAYHSFVGRVSVFTVVCFAAALVLGRSMRPFFSWFCEMSLLLNSILLASIELPNIPKQQHIMMMTTTSTTIGTKDDTRISFWRNYHLMNFLVTSVLVGGLMFAEFRLLFTDTWTTALAIPDYLFVMALLCIVIVIVIFSQSRFKKSFTEQQQQKQQYNATESTVPHLRHRQRNKIGVAALLAVIQQLSQSSNCRAWWITQNLLEVNAVVLTACLPVLMNRLTGVSLSGFGYLIGEVSVTVIRPIRQLVIILLYSGPLRWWGHVQLYHYLFYSVSVLSLLTFVVALANVSLVSSALLHLILFGFPVILGAALSAGFPLIVGDLLLELEHNARVKASSSAAAASGSSLRHTPQVSMALLLCCNTFLGIPIRHFALAVAHHILQQSAQLSERGSIAFNVLLVGTSLLCSSLAILSWRNYNLNPKRVAALREDFFGNNIAPPTVTKEMILLHTKI